MFNKMSVYNSLPIWVQNQENIQYYTESFKKTGFSAYEFNDLKQMERFPVLNKADVNRDYDRFLTKGID